MPRDPYLPFQPFLRVAVLCGFTALASCDGASAETHARTASPVDSVRAAARDSLVRDSVVRDSAARDSASRARQDSINRARPDYVVDSIFPIEEQLRRFRSGLPRVTRLAGGAPSRDSLVRAVVRAVELDDSAATRRLTLSISEFAWLLYPTSEYASGPMEQAPQLNWFMLESASERGRSRLHARLGGHPLGFQSTVCPDAPVRQGNNLLQGNCLVRLRSSDAGVVTMRLFSTLVSRDGIWKVLSWGNDF